MLLWRPHLSTYHHPHYSREEEKIAQKHGLAYAGPETPLQEIIDHSERDIAMLTNTHVDVSSLPEAVCKRLCLMIHPNSGYDNYPYAWVKRSSFPIILGNPLRSHAVSNTILSHLYHHFSPRHHDKTWDPKRDYQRKLLSEQTVYLIGHGHIGKLLEQALIGQVKKLIISDPLTEKIPNSEEISQASVIIPVPSLTKSSREMINQDFLSILPKDFCLINCARGELVCMDDLVKTLEKQSQASAYLDVFPKEPHDFSPYKHLPNLYTTSHIAGVYKELGEQTLQFIDQTLKHFLNDKREDFLKNYESLNLSNKSEQHFL